MPVTRPPTSTSRIRRHTGRAPAARAALAALPLLLLTACGGGSDGDPVTPPPVVTPPGKSFVLGGTVTGLGEGRSVVLKRGDVDELTITANGRFTMGRRITPTEPYLLTIASHPEGQRCTVSQLVTLPVEQDVTNLSLNCVSLPVGTQNLGGVVTGLVEGGTLVLQNNQGENLTLKADGRFVFNTAVAGGSSYAVQVQTQPMGQTCTVVNGSGTVGSADVRAMQVACAGVPQAMPEGAWTTSRCTVYFDLPSTRGYFNILREGESRYSFTQGKVTSPACGNVGTVTLDDALKGSVVFDRQETRGQITAFWGTQTTGAGTKRVVWARKGPYLCLLPRATFEQPNPVKDYPTLDSVEKDTDEALKGDTPLNGWCYLKSPS